MSEKIGEKITEVLRRYAYDIYSDDLTSVVPELLTIVREELSELKVEHDLHGTMLWSDEEENMFNVGIISTKHEMFKRLE